jgi:Ca2+-binding RTX toxin-like protein
VSRSFRVRMLAAGWLLFASLVFGAAPEVASPAVSAQYSPPSWLPLRSSSDGEPFRVGCVKNNCPGPYHGYWAIDLLDQGHQPGAPVFAAGAGKVVSAVGSNSACGGEGTPSNYVRIDHGNGIVSRYVHLATVFVSAGDLVDENTQLGTVGSVGYTDPCPTYHLHFEVIIGGARVDPGSLSACHGSTHVRYPSALGYASWNAVSFNTAGVWSDGTGCATPSEDHVDVNGDGVADLMAVKSRNTGSGKTEVHTLLGPVFGSIWQSRVTSLNQDPQHNLTFPDTGPGLLPSPLGVTRAGTAGEDTLRGTVRNDVLFGRQGADRLYGLAGSDRLVGGRGRDRLVGGAGKDRLEAVDESRDRVRCGPGRDTAIVDRRDSLSGCERVIRRSS